MDFLTILVTAIIVSVVWFLYLKFFKKDDLANNLNDLKDKDHEIELIKLEHEKDLSILKEKLKSLEAEKSLIETTLTNERETTKDQLKTLGKVDDVSWITFLI